MPKLLTIPSMEYWDNNEECFVNTKEFSFTIEHSLVSLRKWEQKHKKVFLSNREKTPEEMIDYISCMCLTKNVPKEYFGYALTMLGEEINDYINHPMSALVFDNDDVAGSATTKKDVVSYEMIHYWMIANQIPTEYTKWHLSALMSLIRVCSIKNTPPKKQNRQEAIARAAAKNKARRAKYGSKG